MHMSVLTLVALAAIVVVEDGSPREEAPISVPRSRAVVIDGTLEESEWRGSAVVRGPEGDILLRHDGKYLYIGVRAARRGFPSVCFARGDTVRVAHASFALGEVAYTRNGTAWRLGAPFAWEALARTLGAEAEQRRARFLAEHGWIGSTVPMGHPRHAEMQIALDQLDARDLRIGVAFFLEDEGRGEAIASWARGLRDDCANNRLVRGYAPERLTFRKKTWTKLTLAPAPAQVKRSPKPRLAPKTGTSYALRPAQRARAPLLHAARTA
jgi:hypothetical protein